MQLQVVQRKHQHHWYLQVAVMEPRKKEEKVDNGDQRPNRKETQDGLEDRNTSDAPTSTEAAPPTAETVNNYQTNDTATKGNSDGSTAVSHTTSPLLLLLVVACAAAAAAAVMAA
ncbi:mucin-associated surface protein (MASP) [Trypanosoma cruzi]|nr:mucin-associated surface protein (MASP) [Trypanosoma cruzi]